MGTRDDRSPAPDLTTPTLKSDKYSTGRGGQGNMAKNDFDRPELARERQDVEAPPMKMSEGAYHVGRGGAANTHKPADDEAEYAKEHNARVRSVSRGREGPIQKDQGLAEKGKELLLGGGKHKS